MFDVFELLPQIGLSDAVFFSHTYTVPIDQKVERMKRVIRDWDPRTDKRKKPKKRSKSMTSSHQKTPKAAAALAATASQAVTAATSSPAVTKEKKPHWVRSRGAVFYVHMRE
jgi:hypothetical protein